MALVAQQLARHRSTARAHVVMVEARILAATDCLRSRGAHTLVNLGVRHGSPRRRMSQGQLRDRKACACRYASCTSISTRREDVVARLGVDELAETEGAERANWGTRARPCLRRGALVVGEGKPTGRGEPLGRGLTSTGRGGFFGGDPIAIAARNDQALPRIRSLSTPITGVITRGIEARDARQIESWT
jgi:hypothetical protein